MKSVFAFVAMTLASEIALAGRAPICVMQPLPPYPWVPEDVRPARNRQLGKLDVPYPINDSLVPVRTRICTMRQSYEMLVKVSGGAAAVLLPESCTDVNAKSVSVVANCGSRGELCDAPSKPPLQFISKCRNDFPAPNVKRGKEYYVAFYSLTEGQLRDRKFERAKFSSKPLPMGRSYVLLSDDVHSVEVCAATGARILSSLKADGSAADQSVVSDGSCKTVAGRTVWVEGNGGATSGTYRYIN